MTGDKTGQVWSYTIAIPSSPLKKTLAETSSHGGYNVALLLRKANNSFPRSLPHKLNADCELTFTSA